MRALGQGGRDEVFEYLHRVRARLDAGDRGRGARRRRAPADLAEQAAGRALGRDHRGLPPRRPALDLDGDVRPHRGAARAGPSTCASCARCRSAPAASPSSCRSASSPSTRCSAAPTGSRRSRREENLKHTAAFRLALGKTIPNLQASWVKMGLDAATEALRWGVNDLGGTLMEENISRMAGSQHGVRLEPEQLIEAARAGGRVPAQRTRSTRSSRPTERPMRRRSIGVDARDGPGAAARAAAARRAARSRARARPGADRGRTPAASAAPTCTSSTAS